MQGLPPRGGVCTCWPAMWAQARKNCASLRKKRVSPHVLRHAAAMELLWRASTSVFRGSWGSSFWSSGMRRWRAGWLPCAWGEAKPSSGCSCSPRWTGQSQNWSTCTGSAGISRPIYAPWSGPCGSITWPPGAKKCWRKNSLWRPMHTTWCGRWLCESHTLVLRRLGGAYSRQWLGELLEGAVLLNPEPADYLSAAAMLDRFPDQPITLIDAVTAMLTRRLAINVWSYGRVGIDSHASI